ncbi:hypothetical protein DPMN_004293 [Dreissena polymorpha]|uniref:Uncharacterized protein n=1 Tax=Dreissena polymorpha TaxID=45954 RepID=A0A9D4RTF5_DREPO|nr:hypothetical protein DPMN_004293 [Dreissena polymorpha]
MIFIEIIHGRRGVTDMMSAWRPGGHGFDPHRGSVLSIFPKDTKYWFKAQETDSRAF